MSRLAVKRRLVRRCLFGLALTCGAPGAGWAQECREASQTLYVSNLCPAADPQPESRDRPYERLVDALVEINDPSNPHQHVKVVLLPTRPAEPHQGATISTPGKCITIVSAAGPGLTACGPLTLTSDAEQITLQGLYFATPGSDALTLTANANVRVRNCVFHGCGSGIQSERVNGVRLLVENSIFSGCKDALRLWFDDSYTLVNCVFARQVGRVLSMYDNFSGTNTTFDYCVFCANADFSPYRAMVLSSPECPPADTMFVDEMTANFHLGDESGLFNVGHPGRQYLNPDGTRNTVGAYGGPYAVPFPSRSPNADAEIVDVQVEKDAETGKLRVRARVRVKQ